MNHRIPAPWPELSAPAGNPRYLYRANSLTSQGSVSKFLRCPVLLLLSVRSKGLSVAGPLVTQELVPNT